MSDATPRDLADKIRRGLADQKAFSARQKAFAVVRPRMQAQVARHPGLRERIRGIKERALGRLEDLIAEAERSLRRRGFHVHLAPDAAAARRYVLALVGQGPVIKSKSNLVKEIDLIEALTERGVEVVETDLGDRIVQLADDHPSHPLAPAIHLSEADVRELFGRVRGGPLPEGLDAIAAFARQDLRQRMLGARVGLTGANAIAVDTGTVVLMENEGNIRMVTGLPPLLIVVASVNKLVHTLEEALDVTRGASVYGGGHEIGTYVSMISGPAPAEAAAEGIGPAEVHVLLVDNGRTAAARDGFAEAFYCLNCGSCHNYCSPYNVLGREYGGGDFIGGIGAVQASLIQGLAAGVAAGLDLCMLCEHCVQVCPVGIDIPHLTMRLRERAGAKRSLPERLVLRLVRRPGALSAFARAITVYRRAGLQRWVRRKRLLDRFRSLQAAEALLPDDEEALQSEADGAPPVVALQDSSPPGAPRVGLLRGCIAGAFQPRTAEHTAALVAAAGAVPVQISGPVCCGALHLHAGDLATARDLARRTIARFESASVETVVANAAGCGAMMKRYGELLADDAGWRDRAERVAARVRDLSEWLVSRPLPPLATRGPVRVTYQDACHLSQAQGITAEPRRLLSAVHGVELVEMEDSTLCCGSAGTYNLRFPEVAAAAGAEKVRSILATGAQVVVTANPGCALHLQATLRQAGASDRVKVRLMADFLAGALPRTGEDDGRS